MASSHYVMKGGAPTIQNQQMLMQKGIGQGQSRQPPPDVFVKKSNTAGNGVPMTMSNQVLQSQGFGQQLTKEQHIQMMQQFQKKPQGQPVYNPQQQMLNQQKMMMKMQVAG